MRRIDGKRSEQGKNLSKEIILEPGLFLLRHLRPVDQHDALLGQGLPKLPPALLLIPCQHAHGFSDAGKLFGGRQSVGAFDGNSSPQLALEAGHADHEKLVEVIGGNREEPDPLKQGMGVIGGFFEHPAVEMQPGQLSIDKTLRACLQLDRRGVKCRGSGR